MADDQKDRFIQYLADQHREDELTKKAMELVLEDFMARQKELDEKMSALMSEHSSMKAELFEERRLRKAAERENRSLRERLGQANEERSGRLKSRSRTAMTRKATLTARKVPSVPIRLMPRVPKRHPKLPGRIVTCPTVLTLTSAQAWRVPPCIWPNGSSGS